MAYTKTYQFGSSAGNGEALSGGELFKLSLVFTINDTGNNINYFAGNYGLYLQKYGRISLDKEPDDKLLTNGDYQVIAIDEGHLVNGVRVHEFDELFFEGVDVDKIEKEVEAKIEVLYNGNSLYTEEFIGHCDLQSISYDYNTKIFEATFKPKTNLLKETFLYKKLDDGTLQYNNPLGLSNSLSGKKRTWAGVYLKVLIEKIFQKVNASSSLSKAYTSVIFVGNNQNADPQIKNVTFDDIVIEGDRIGAIFGSSNNCLQIETLYDLLTRLAFSFGFYCGMIHSNKPFIKFLYEQDLTPQTIGTVKSVKKAYCQYGVNSVKAIERWIDRRQINNENDYPIGLSFSFLVPEDATLEGSDNINEEMIYWSGDPSQTVMPAGQSDLFYPDFLQNKLYYIEAVIFSAAPGVLPESFLGSQFAALHYYLKNKRQLARIYEFVIDGIGYDYLKGFSWNNKSWNIISMIKDFDMNETTVKAIAVYETNENVGGGHTEEADISFLRILPAGYYNDFTYTKEIIGSEMIGTIGVVPYPAKSRIKEVTIHIPTYLQNGVLITGLENITSINLLDGDGIIRLGASEFIKWKAENGEELDVDGIRTIIYVNKNYNDKGNLMISFEGTAENSSAINIIATILKASA